MKYRIKTTVINELGSWTSDVTEVEGMNDISKLREFFKRASDLNYLTIDIGMEKVYFPEEIIRKSVIVLSVVEIAADERDLKICR